MAGLVLTKTGEYVTPAMAYEIGRQERQNRSGTLATNVFAALLIIALYYMAYRYPFQIGDTRSSPTYKATPQTLQMGKYALIATVLVVTLLVSTANAQRPKLEGLAASLAPPLLGIMGFFAVVKGQLTDSTDMIITGFLMVSAAIVASLRVRWTIDAVKLARIVTFFAVVAVLVEAVQVALFQTVGRLPALGYKNSVSVRFGSLLDDPNTFAILVALLVPTVYVAWRGVFWRWTIILLLMASLVLTQSFTGIAAVALTLAIGIFLLTWTKPLAIAAFIAVVPLMLFAIFQYASTSKVVDQVLETKAGSISARTTSWEALGDLTFEDFVGLSVPTTFVESSYVSMIVSFGVFFTAAYVGLGLAAIYRLHRIIMAAENRRDVAFHFGLFFFMIAFLIASANMQFDGIFPANFLYYLGICVSLFIPTKVTSADGH